MTPTLEELLSLDPASPAMLRAQQLADNDRALLDALVAMRRDRGLTQAQVGESMGVSQPSVADFEAYDANPTLARIRRYAHAVEALIVHKVEADEGQLLDEARRSDWVHTTLRDVSVAHSASASRASVFQLEQADALGMGDPVRDGDFSLAA